MVGEDPNHSNNVKLSAYNDFLRELAKEKKCLLADLNAEMQQSLKSWRFEKFTNRDDLRQERLGELFYALSRRKRKQKTRLIENLLFPSNI